MAKKYVLGPNAARKVAALLRGSGEVSRRQGAAPGLAFDAEYVAPFAVQWAQSADGGGAWIIWLPGENLVVATNATFNPAAELVGVGGEYPPGWYVLDGSMLDRSGGGTLYLILDMGDEPGAVFDSSPAAGQDGKLSIPICEASVDSATGERKVRQFVASEIVVDGKREVPDGVSIERRDPEESAGADDEGDARRLQFKDFDSDESDSPRGLVERMRVDTKTGAISADGAGGLMLVARRNMNDGSQKLVYIPLSRDGEDPEDEGEDDPGRDPCEHPEGGSPGVPADMDDSPDSGGASPRDDPPGAVRADGDTHLGDDGCNC